MKIPKYKINDNVIITFFGTKRNATVTAVHSDDIYSIITTGGLKISFASADLNSKSKAYIIEKR